MNTLNKAAQTEKALASVTKEKILATIAFLDSMGVEANYGRYSITDGVRVYGASQVVRTMVELFGVTLQDCALSLVKLVELLNSLGVPVTDLGAKKERVKAEKAEAKKKVHAAASIAAVAVPASASPDTAEALSALIRSIISQELKKA